MPWPGRVTTSRFVADRDQARPVPSEAPVGLRRAERVGIADTPLRSLIIGVISVAIGLLVWEALVRRRVVPDYMLPAPGEVWQTWWALAQNGVLWHHVSATLQEAFLGFGAAFLVGSAIGYPLAKSRLVASVLSPYIAGTQAMPILALAPLLVVWFGLGLLSKTLICAVIVFFPILVNTSLGLRTVERSLLEAARTEGANAWQILWRIEVPLALRTILGGIKMGLTLSFTGAIVAEFVASDAGLGYLMTAARSEYDTPLLFAAALSIVGLAVLGYVLINLLERLVITWE